MRLSLLAAGLAALTLGLSGCGSEDPAPAGDPQAEQAVERREEPTSRPVEELPPPPRVSDPAPARPAPPPDAQPATAQQRVVLEGDFEPTLEDVMGQISRQVRAQIVVDSRARDRRVSLEGIDQARTPWNVLVEILAGRAKCRVQSSSSGVLMIVPRR